MFAPICFRFFLKHLFSFLGLGFGLCVLLGHAIVYFFSLLSGLCRLGLGWLFFLFHRNFLDKTPAFWEVK